MPIIRSSADLRNSYNEISKLCHEYNEPVYITKNGKGDLAVMSIEAHEYLLSRIKFYEDLAEGLKDSIEGRTQSLDEAFAEIRESRKR